MLTCNRTDLHEQLYFWYSYLLNPWFCSLVFVHVSKDFKSLFFLIEEIWNHNNTSKCRPAHLSTTCLKPNSDRKYFLSSCNSKSILPFSQCFLSLAVIIEQLNYFCWNSSQKHLFKIQTAKSCFLYKMPANVSYNSHYFRDLEQAIKPINKHIKF